MNVELSAVRQTKSYLIMGVAEGGCSFVLKSKLSHPVYDDSQLWQQNVEPVPEENKIFHKRYFSL